MPLVGPVDKFVGTVSLGLEVLAAIVVGYGAIIAFYRVFMKSIFTRAEHSQYEKARVDLGRMLVVGLEFEIGSDLLQTAISPTWNRIGIVAAIVALRSALNFLLERDIERLEMRIKRAQEQTSDEKGG